MTEEKQVDTASISHKKQSIPRLLQLISRFLSHHNRRLHHKMMRMAQTSAVKRRMYRKQLFFAAAAAAFSTLPGTATVAFTIAPQRTVRIASRTDTAFYPPTSYVHGSLPTTRHYSSRRNDEEGGGGVLSTIKNAAKSVAKTILPSSWFQTDKEKQQAIERKRYRDEVNGGIKELLKDAPLPIRMMGSMVGPLFSSAMSTMAESLAEQQKTVEDYMSQARLCLQTDEAVVRLLGDPIQVGSPFSQSSSTSSINGQTTTRVEIGFPVSGSRGSGVAQLSATEAGLQRLVLQAEGRQINVSLSSKPFQKFPRSKNDKNDDDGIIEAEIIEKDTRR